MIEHDGLMQTALQVGASGLITLCVVLAMRFCPTGVDRVERHRFSFIPLQMMLALRLFVLLMAALYYANRD